MSFWISLFVAVLILASVINVYAEIDVEDFSPDMKSRMDRLPSDVRSRMSEHMRNRHDDIRDMGSRRKSPRSHEERTRNDKEDNYKHREFLRKRADDHIGRISKAAFQEHEKQSLIAKIEEIHAHEMTLADSRLQIVLDFEGVREMHDKEARRAHLDERKRRREIQREKDNVTREKIKELRQHVDSRLRAAERGEDL